jgi:uncharacterized glyoxalase superfamily protein PhnB
VRRASARKRNVDLFKEDAMPGNANNTTSTVIPGMRYRDAPAAIEWLCRAFGFKAHLVVPGENGSIAHAQVFFGNGMIMLGSASDDEFGRWVKPPQEIGGAGTQSAYVIVEDVDAHHSRAKAAAAEIVGEVEDQPYGDRLYSCRARGPFVELRLLRPLGREIEHPLSTPLPMISKLGVSRGRAKASAPTP